uniref:Uncharacterized protein n=1 Tax=Chromera velia CCMP2878 TaxID=1169474 RepID=A0A0G4HMY2_9ALVE|eukprot:Cvel_7552.t1-p1 / transcript=Cvel_7552.t1 / gene=Cvel_7552 / organism=Chromera_velia_CCMP2878 / gene_product=hypothetical protein / transcript_product=hypothetical protein / location=Cvel_scaffold397:28276-35085(+) / protein_length=466 / sequence_SO=supercontig / SO=protein_coding / is_pseudo=false
MSSLFKLHFVLCFLLPFVRWSKAVCYLTGDADCAVCWLDSGTVDAVPSAPMPCPPGLQLVWDTPPPDSFYEDEISTAVYTFTVDTDAYPTVKSRGKDISHGNVHSCLAGRGACTPFVSNSPGLSTHTEALTADLTNGNTASFRSEMELSAEKYVAIAHVQYFTVIDGEQHRYDLAIGRPIEVLPAQGYITAEGWITLGVVCGVALLLIGGFSWMILRGKGQLHSAILWVFNRTVTMSVDVIFGVGDAVAFTTALVLDFQSNPKIVPVIPIYWLFMGVAWMVSVIETWVVVNDIRRRNQLRNFRSKQTRKLLHDISVHTLRLSVDSISKDKVEHFEKEILMKIAVLKADMYKYAGALVSLIFGVVPLLALQITLSREGIKDSSDREQNNLKEEQPEEIVQQMYPARTGADFETYAPYRESPRLITQSQGSGELLDSLESELAFELGSDVEGGRNRSVRHTSITVQIS